MGDGTLRGARGARRARQSEMLVNFLLSLTAPEGGARRARQSEMLVNFLLSLLATGAISVPLFTDSTLGVSQIVSSQPERNGVYLGSPSLLALPSGSLLASHDFFGAKAGGLVGITCILISRSNGPFVPAGNASGLYWATLFSRAGDPNAYLLGTSGDERSAGHIAIARSGDEGATWTVATLVAGAQPFSTGPTPVLQSGGRLWRAFEHNVGPGWASGYASVVLSAAADAPDLLAPAAWTLSGALPFAAVAPLVPANWSAAPPPYSVRGGFGWLEGNAVERGPEGGAGIYVLLRVNSAPAANQAALLELAGPAAAPTFKGWVEPCWGGNSKFSVKRDARTGLYVTLATNVAEPAGVTLPPACGPVALPRGALPCCGFLDACAPGAGNASCVWCHANNRNQLSLAVARAAGGPWLLAGPPILFDDTGVPAFVSEMGTGFQYADFVFSGADIVASVRAGYRGSENFHNSNRHLLKVIANWTSLVPPALLER